MSRHTGITKRFSAVFITLLLVFVGLMFFTGQGSSDAAWGASKPKCPPGYKAIAPANPNGPEPTGEDPIKGGTICNPNPERQDLGDAILSKKATKAEKPGEYWIDLRVEGKKSNKEVDIVLSVDASGSMFLWGEDPNGNAIKKEPAQQAGIPFTPRWTYVKKAIDDFTGVLIPTGTENVNIGTVLWSYESRKKAYTKDKNVIHDYIAGMYRGHRDTVNYPKASGTQTDLGIRRGMEMLEGRPAQNKKIMVLISDGYPSASFEALAVEEYPKKIDGYVGVITNTDRSKSAKPNTSKPTESRNDRKKWIIDDSKPYYVISKTTNKQVNWVPGSGGYFKYNLKDHVAGDCNWYQRNKDLIHGPQTVFDTDKPIRIAMDSWAYPTISEAIMQRKKNPEVTIITVGTAIGDLPPNAVKADAVSTLKAIATKETNYIDAKNASDLPQKLKKLADRLKKTIQNGAITDPMGEAVDLKLGEDSEFDQTADVEITASSQQAKDETIVKFDDVAKKLTVDGLNLGENEWVNVRYKVRLKDNFRTGDNVSTNGDTYLDHDGNPQTPALKFRVPQVELFDGSAKITKTFDNKEPAENQIANFKLFQKVGAVDGEGNTETDDIEQEFVYDTVRKEYIAKNNNGDAIDITNPIVDVPDSIAKTAPTRIVDAKGRLVRKKGEVFVRGLWLGEYYFKEVSTDTDYVIEKNPIEFTVVKDPNRHNDLFVDNKKKLTEVKIKKVWKGGPKTGATLQLWRRGWHATNGQFGDPATRQYVQVDEKVPDTVDFVPTATVTEKIYRNLPKTDHKRLPYEYYAKETTKPTDYEKTENGLNVTNTYQYNPGTINKLVIGATDGVKNTAYQYPIKYVCSKDPLGANPQLTAKPTVVGTATTIAKIPLGANCRVVENISANDTTNLKKGFAWKAPVYNGVNVTNPATVNNGFNFTSYPTYTENPVNKVTVTNEVIPVAQVVKTHTGTEWHYDAQGQWNGKADVSFDIVVTNPSTITALKYDLQDTVTAPNGTTVNHIKITRGATTIYDGDYANLPAKFITERDLAVNTSETYKVVLTVTGADAGVLKPADKQCKADGNSLNNTATVTSNGITETADDCADVPAKPAFNAAKTAIADKVTYDDQTKQYTAQYTVSITNTSAHASKILNDVTDTLKFPASATVVSASKTENGTKVQLPADIVAKMNAKQPFIVAAKGSGAEIAGNARRDIIVEVVFTVDDTHAEFTSEKFQCKKVNNAYTSGLINRVDMHGDTDATDNEACQNVEQKLKMKKEVLTTVGNGGLVTNADGTTTVYYAVVVENSGAITQNTGEILDKPDFSEHYTIEKVWIDATQANIGKTEVAANANGDYVVTNGVNIGVGETKTFYIAVKVSTDVDKAGIAPEKLLCKATNNVPEAGYGLFNEATIAPRVTDPAGTNSKDVDGSDNNKACTAPSTLEIVKISTQKNADGSFKTLSGAEFALYTTDPTTPNAVALPKGVILNTNGNDGGSAYHTTALVKGQTYWLVETKAPGGHNLMPAAVKFEYATDGTVKVLGENPEHTLVTATGIKITVQDTEVGKLPVSGGIGFLPYFGMFIFSLIVLMVVRVMPAKR